MRDSLVTREAPRWFREELVRRFGSGHDCEWDTAFQRWVIISPTAKGLPHRQLVVWRFDPNTGAMVQPDALGVLPMRELTLDCQREILDQMEKSSLTNRHDGAGTWRRQVALTLAHNKRLGEAYLKQGAADYATTLTEADLRRPWIKHYDKNPTLRRIAWGG